MNLTAALSVPVDLAAQYLLGTYLHANDVTLRLTETEAYGGVGEDPASHAHRGQTARNAAMFSAPGTLYVYFSYGMHWCANVVCDQEGRASAVLLRAGEIVDGLAIAIDRTPTQLSNSRLASGPARLCRVLGIQGDLNGVSVLEPRGPVRVMTPGAGWPASPGAVSRGPRVGVSGAADRPWRFWLADSMAISSYRAGKRRSESFPENASRSARSTALSREKPE